jgi:hypothetical protein
MSCVSRQQNTGIPRCTENVGYDVKFVVCPRGTVITTQALAETFASWKTLFNAEGSSRCYPFPKHFLVEPAANESVYETGSGNQQKLIVVNPGKSKFTLLMESLCLAKKLRSFNNGSWSVFPITSTGGIRGITDSTNTLFMPIPYFFNIDSIVLPTPSTFAKQPIIAYPEDAEIFDKSGVVIYPTAFNPITEFDGIHDVVITAVSAPTATGWVIKVETWCDSVPVNGLLVSDFIMHDKDGALITITSVTATGDGEYTFVFPTKTVSVTVQLKNQPDMTLKGYEDDGVAVSGNIAA